MISLNSYRSRIGGFHGGRSGNYGRNTIGNRESKYRKYLLRKIFHRKALNLWKIFANSSEFAYLIDRWKIDTSQWDWAPPTHKKAVPLFHGKLKFSHHIFQILLFIANDFKEDTYIDLIRKEAQKIWDKYAHSPEFAYLVSLWGINTTEWKRKWSPPNHNRGCLYLMAT